MRKRLSASILVALISGRCTEAETGSVHDLGGIWEGAVPGVEGIMGAIDVTANLPAGEEVVLMEGFMARDGSNHVNGRNVTLPDGRRVFGGSADGGPGAIQ